MKKGVKFLIFFILIALIWIIFLLLFKSRITGYSINAKNFYLVGENLEGFYNLKLRQGELWPLDAKVIVRANNITKELSLRDWLEQSGIDYEIIYGNFYVYDKNIYGYGEGFGKIGKYIEKPNIKFEIKIYSKEKEEKPVEEEHPVEIKPEIPVEQPAPIEQPQETIEQPQEEIPSQTEQPTEVEQPVEQPQLPPEEAETPTVPEQPSEQPEKPEAEKVQEGIFSRLIKYGPLNFFYFFRNLVGFAITNEIEGEKIIQAYVNIDNPYILEINENQYAEFVSGSVKINDIPADDNFIKFEKKDNKIIVTTDYKIEREGFGKEFLGEEFYINLSLNIFNLTFDKEGVYDLDVEIIYNNIILDKASAKIFVEKSNQTYYIIKLIDEKGRVIKEINISKNETREGIKLKIKEEKIILEKPEEIKVLSLIPFVKAQVTQLPKAQLPICGNNECESGEDTSNCPSDCPFTIYNYRGGDISVQFISPSQELINKGILTEIVYSTPADFDYALIKLNKIDPSLEISKILKCENWNAITASCVGNFIPVDIPFIDYGDYIVINITNFSAYAGGAGYNASLVIWDSSDARAIGINETIFFYANYSTYPEGIPINDSNGICLAFFSFENRPGFSAEMQFNYSSMLWETSFLTTEDMVGINNFTVNCSSSNYDNLTASDEFIIQNISVNIITNCTEINQSGIYRLNGNLTATSSSSFDGACIKIASDNVIFDCNNYAIINDLTDPVSYIIKISKRTLEGVGTGYNVSIKNCEIYNAYYKGIEIDTFNNLNLENIKILNQEEGCCGIDIYDSNNISINNYYYEGSGAFGLTISNSSYLIARNINIINYLYGYEIIGECISANILNNSIFDEGFLNCSINLRLNGGSNINISNFYITHGDIRAGGENIIIENNTFEDIYSFEAIDFWGSENIFIRNNIFKNVKGEYIKVDSSNNFEIYNNTFYYNSSEGLFNIIYLSASNNGIIKDNKFIYDDFTDSSQPLNNSSFIEIGNDNSEIIKFENNYFKWEENEFYFDALIINTTSIYAYKGSPPSSPNNLIPLNKSLIIYQYSHNNRIDLNISFDPIYNNISYYKIDLLNDSGWLQQYTEIINNKAYTYFETPELNETYVFLSLFGEAPAECTCNSCEDCMNKLNNPSCTEVKLVNDIINIDRNPCINISFSNKIFDCQNYSIIGNETTLIDYVAILINPASNVTIKNCNIERFYNAILLGIGSRSPKNYNFINIINNTLLNNSRAITYSEEIEIYNSQIENNTLIDNIFGIKFKGSNNIIRNNKIRGRYRSNATHMETIGIMIYQPSRSTLIDNNIVCKHVYDIKADTYASGIQNYCDVAINFSDSNASGCKKKTDINFDIKSYLLKSDKIPIIKFDVILYSNISAKARLYSKYNWKEEWKPNFGASSCIRLLGGSIQESSEELTLQESTSKESIITSKLIQESVGEESISLPPPQEKPSLPPPEPIPPSKPPSKPPIIFTLCSSSGELVSVSSGDEIFAEGYGIVSPTEPCMEGRESYNITFQDAFPYKDCSNNTIMEFEYYKIEFENFCNKKESDVYLRKTNELIKSPSKQTGINFVSFTTDIRYGGIAVASDGKMAIVTPEDIDCTIQLPIELKAVSPWITLSSSSELLTSCISRKLQEENSSARLIYASYWDEERQMYVGHPASLFANAYIKDFPIKLGKSYFVDVNKNLTFTQFGKLPPESIWHEIKAVGEKINIITLTPHQQNITTVRQLCNLSFVNPYGYVEYWDPINQNFLQVESQRCMFSTNTALDLSIPYRVSVIKNYSGLIP
ncbi:MAG: hypothetical protein QXM27_01660 [Candidatus Pacearchaeota archaeon]